MACRSVGLKADAPEKDARPIRGEVTVSDAGLGAAKMLEGGEVGLFAASALKEDRGASGSRLGSWCFERDFRPFSCRSR